MLLGSSSKLINCSADEFTVQRELRNVMLYQKLNDTFQIKFGSVNSGKLTGVYNTIRRFNLTNPLFCASQNFRLPLLSNFNLATKGENYKPDMLKSCFDTCSVIA